MESSKLALVLICAMGLGMAHVSRAQNSPEDYVDTINAARSQVGIEPVEWDEPIADYARSYANERKDCLPKHSNGPYGETITIASSPNFSAADAVKTWVDEKQYYNYESNTCQAGKECGHYRQVVWRDTGLIGCAQSTCKDGGVFVVCSYDPAGNFEGERPY